MLIDRSIGGSAAVFATPKLGLRYGICPPSRRRVWPLWEGERERISGQSPP